ncbi:hypothetical protein D3C87_1462730 [compost metagenome]
MLGAARVTYQQYLTAFFQPFKLAFLVAVIHPGSVPAAETVRLAVQPGRAVLCAQAGQAMAKKPGGQAFEQRHLGQRTKFRWKIGGVLRHADGLQGLRLLRAMVSAFTAEF